MNFSDHQIGIYAQGMFTDQKPKITTNLAKLEDQAAARLTPEALGYIVASAGSGSTARANREAFDRWRIAPRMLRSAAERDHSVTVLGTELPAPVLIAPVGIQTLAHPDGELATARAAAALGIPYIHSTQASHSFEQVAEAGGDAPRWYQLYWPTDESVLLSFLDRAKTTGFTTLVLTLDTTLLGWRPADLDRGYLPFLANLGIENYLTDPAFKAGLEQPVETNPIAAAMHWAKMFPNPGLNWGQLKFLRDHWDGPIVLKGICTVGDARSAVEHGVEGIVVSNHGGRTLDGQPGSAAQLPAVVQAAAGQVRILVDGGIQRGTDVLKLLALGADAVLVGRPAVYALAVAGALGVAHVMHILRAELETAMALTGCATLADIGPHVLAQTQ